mmetsp:Transcript_26169/g.67660  ORF Transcript_26169/g.67660 Transcript_26169/m.67660 type:complete len:334 (+) Transcript_26169:74-1075(+)
MPWGTAAPALDHYTSAAEPPESQHHLLRPSGGEGAIPASTCYLVLGFWLWGAWRAPRHPHASISSAGAEGSRSLSANSCATSWAQGPLKMLSTRTSSLKGSSGSSLGVSRKHCGVSGLQADSTSCWNTLRSLLGSMPWLISSTTRKGHSVTPCSAMRYRMVQTERSPPLCRLAVSTCSSSSSRNFTRIWTSYLSKSSSSFSRTSPAKPISLKLIWKVVLILATSSCSSGSQRAFFSSMPDCPVFTMRVVSSSLPSRFLIFSTRSLYSFSTLGLLHAMASASAWSSSISWISSAMSSVSSAILALCASFSSSFSGMGASREALSLRACACCLAL